eukprot:746082-Hanusia_phi.AAC.3
MIVGENGRKKGRNLEKQSKVVQDEGNEMRSKGAQRQTGRTFASLPDFFFTFTMDVSSFLLLSNCILAFSAFLAITEGNSADGASATLSCNTTEPAGWAQQETTPRDRSWVRPFHTSQASASSASVDAAVPSAGQLTISLLFTCHRRSLASVAPPGRSLSHSLSNQLP